MKMLHAGIAAAIGVLAFSSAQAQVGALDCTGCSIAQIQELAKICSSGYTYVSDFAANKLYKLCFTIDVNDEYQPPRKEKDYQWLIPEPQYQQVFQDYENVYINNGHVVSLSMYVHIPTMQSSMVRTSISSGGNQAFAATDDGSVNAYDTVVSSSDNSRVVSYLMNNNFNTTEIGNWNPPFGSALVAAIAQLENALKSDLFSFQNFNATYIVEFPDGSHRTYQFDPAAHTFAAVPGTAYDAHGNKIPENANMASNGGGTASYDYIGSGPNYDEPNMETLLRNLGAQGIPVVSGSGGHIDCSWNGSTNTLSCTIKQF